MFKYYILMFFIDPRKNAARPGTAVPCGCEQKYQEIETAPSQITICGNRTDKDIAKLRETT